LITAAMAELCHLHFDLYGKDEASFIQAMNWLRDRAIESEQRLNAKSTMELN
jgi:hypothetical protein